MRKKAVCLFLAVIFMVLCGCGNTVDSKISQNTDSGTHDDGESNMNSKIGNLFSGIMQTAKTEKNENVVCGGTTNNTDYNAPKEIKSDNLVSFSVGFYHEDKYDRSNGMYYTFVVEEDDNGKLILKDNYAAEGFEVDKSVLDGIQAIIKKYELVKSNGYHKTTAGLPPEFEECYLEAKYDSGEYLSFSENSNPSAEWSSELIDYFANIMADNGDEKYLTPKISGVIKRFCLEVKEDNMIYSYDTISVPLGDKEHSLEDIVNGDIDESEFETKIYRSIYSCGDDEVIDEIFAYPDVEYYDGLFNIVRDMEIRDYENFNTLSDFITGDTEPEEYYEFYIEYESGDIMSGASVEPEEIEKFKSLEKSLMEYMDDYLINNQN